MSFSYQNDHSNEVLRQLDRQRTEKLFTDAIINVADREFSAHRAILAANSPTFEQVILKSPSVTLLQNELVVNLVRVDCNAFEILLDYFYGRKLNITMENVEAVYNVSQYLNVESVSKICQRLLASKDDVSSIEVPDEQQQQQQNECCTATEVEILRSSDDVLKVEITQTDGGDCDVDQVDDVITPAPAPPPTNFQSTSNSSSKFSCGVCLKTFATAHNLKVHNRKHTGERPFKCEKCGKKFSDPSVFTKHRNMHEGKRPFSCSQCDRTFATIAQKREHMRSHTKEKPFICKECNKSYRYKGDLTRHLRSHNNSMYGPCKFCGKQFTHSGNYKVHVKTHERKQEQQRNAEGGRMQRFEAVLISSNAFLDNYDVINVIDDDGL